MSEQRFAQALSRRTCLGLLLGAACAFAPGAFAAGPKAPVRVSDAWIRWLPAGLPAGGYMRLHNDGAHMVALIGASSADYGEVMVHHSEMKNGTMHMLPVEKVEIPAHGDQMFQPGGYHIMLMHPRKPVAPGQQVPITLKFSDGTTLEVPFEVRKPDASDAPQGDMHGMSMKSGS
ncbi:MAG: copper chaperone PCu(A)C [Betaproteobacteria bacterium]|nr:copper chaperone PCu(A)C [Betaproteobacteria bacterium]